MKRIIFSLIVSFVFVFFTNAAEVRKWTSGKFIVEAEFIGISEDSKTVTLRKKDGKEINVALEKLSKEDQGYIRLWSKKEEGDLPSQKSIQSMELKKTSTNSSFGAISEEKTRLLCVFKDYDPRLSNVPQERMDAYLNFYQTASQQCTGQTLVAQQVIMMFPNATPIEQKRLIANFTVKTRMGNCMSFAMLLSVGMDKIGINNWLVTVEDKAMVEGHMFNLFEINNQLYFADLTEDVRDKINMKSRPMSPIQNAAQITGNLYNREFKNPEYRVYRIYSNDGSGILPEDFMKAYTNLKRGKDLFGNTPVKAEPITKKTKLSNSEEVVTSPVPKPAPKIAPNSQQNAAKAQEEIDKFTAEHGTDVKAVDENGRTLLHEAMSVAVAMYLISEGADTNARDKDGYTPLDKAVTRGYIEIVKVLVSEGADINAKDKDNSTPLHNALLSENIEIVKFLVSKGANVNTKDKDDFTPLHYAVLSKNIEIVKVLLSEGADINIKDKDGSTPLHHALLSKNIEYEINSIRDGADVNAKNGKDSYTQLYRAVMNKNIEIAKFLVSKGADINAKDNNDSTPLYCAVRTNNIEIVKLLVSKGADVNAKRDGEPLLYRCGNIEIVNFLVSKGAAIDAKTGWGETPLLHAVMNNNIEIVKLLVSKGADVNAKDEWGETSLLRVVMNNNIEIVKFLVSKGADVNFKYSGDDTALHKAVNDNNIEIVKLLISKRADINAKNKKGDTPLDLAKKNGNTAIIQILEKSNIVSRK